MSDETPNRGFCSYFKNIFGSKNNEDVRETIEDLIEEAVDDTGHDEFSEHEQQLLSNLLGIKDKKACRVMIPRSDIIAFQKKGTVEELAQIMVEKGHSRIPVYDESLDDITGFLHIIDLATCLLKGQDKMPVSEIKINPIKVASDDISVLDLLKDMQQNKTHMAVIVDDYGGVSGLVTIEDLLEEIVGDIEDEYDLEENHIITLQEKGYFIADAKAYLDEVKEVTGIDFSRTNEDDDEIDTIGGYVFELAQRIPNKGEIIKGRGGISFKILDVDPSRIKKIMIMLGSDNDNTK
ncbi:MAG: HlyC/CorC family transporter [Alphaproteobacteria bacterium]|nr:HlyC/CorC family transporter [Alphaproteobacteria bacterium]